jgi:amidohydrolase
MPDFSTSLSEIVGDLTPEIVSLRRVIHQHPETAWNERATTARVSDFLTARGVKHDVLNNGVGLVAEVGSGSRSVGFRADLDALPLREATDEPFRSLVKTAMHACGHDAHTAIAAGIAVALEQVDFPGKVRFIFQPAEEAIPGGAVTLVDAGVHKGLDALLAFHVDPSLAAGRIGFRVGGITGASDRMNIELHGPGGHTSRPHQTVDLVNVAGHLIIDLPARLRASVPDDVTLVVVFGSISGGQAENVIPTSVHLGGTLRLFDHRTWNNLESQVRTIVADIITPLGATATITYVKGSPPVVNDGDVIKIATSAITERFGAEIATDTHQSFGSEDFAWYLNDVPGALLRLGCRPDGEPVDLHSAGFRLDERCIPFGVEAAAHALRGLLTR